MGLWGFGHVEFWRGSGGETGLYDTQRITAQHGGKGVGIGIYMCVIAYMEECVHDQPVTSRFGYRKCARL